MNNKAAFITLVRESLDIGWPLSYEGDLYYHDRLLLDKASEGVKFIWILREHGTHLFVLPSSLDLAGVIESAERDGNNLYYWDGEGLNNYTGHMSKILSIYYNSK